MLVEFLPQVRDECLRFAIVAARYQGQWVFCRHRERTTYELPGGHREPGEKIEKTARRELFEETGATVFSLTAVSPYAVTGPTWENPTGYTTYGMLYLAHITALGPLPDFEIAEVRLFQGEPENCTYPLISPKLFERALKALTEAENPPG